MMKTNRSARAISRRSVEASVLLIVVLILWLVLQGSAGAQEEAPSLEIHAVTVEPAAPGPDTLCKLRVELASTGERTASQLDFEVKVNGQELPVYRNQLFMFPVSPGESAEIPLYNFWSTETSRPMPADGKLEVEVTLKAAQWMEIKLEEGVEIWQPLGAVSGLPIAKKLSLAMSK